MRLRLTWWSSGVRAKFNNNNQTDKAIFDPEEMVFSAQPWVFCNNYFPNEDLMLTLFLILMPFYFLHDFWGYFDSMHLQYKNYNTNKRRDEFANVSPANLKPHPQTEMTSCGLKRHFGRRVTSLELGASADVPPIDLLRTVTSFPLWCPCFLVAFFFQVAKGWSIQPSHLFSVWVRVCTHAPFSGWLRVQCYALLG